MIVRFVVVYRLPGNLINRTYTTGRTQLDVHPLLISLMTSGSQMMNWIEYDRTTLQCSSNFFVSLTTSPLLVGAYSGCALLPCNGSLPEDAATFLTQLSGGAQLQT